MATFRCKSQSEKSATPRGMPERKGRKIDIPRFIWIPRSTARPSVEPEFANTIRMRTSNQKRKNAGKKELNAIAWREATLLDATMEETKLNR